MAKPLARSRAVAPVSALLLGLALSPAAATAPPPAGPSRGGSPDELSRKEQEALVDAFLAADRRTEQGAAAAREALDALAGVEFPARSAMKRWDKRFASWRKDLPELEKKAGEHWFWEDEHRGRYFVGGETKKPTALFLGMHGGGVGSGDAGSSAGAYQEACAALGWVGVFPEVLEKTEHGWTTSGTEEFVLDLVDAALRTWDIDPNRVVFGGHSMGGFGSWVLGAHHADRVAALVPSAGAPSPEYDQAGNVRSIMDGVIPNLRNVPMLVFQGSDDERVPPGPNRFAVKELERARKTWGGYEDQEYWEMDGVGHGYPPGGARALLDKVAAYVRDPHPRKVVWQPALPWKRQFYWLYWETPVPGALVVAEVDREKNEIEVTVEGADPAGLHVLIGPGLVDMDRDLTVTLVSLEEGFSEPCDGPAPRSLAPWLLTASTGDPGRTYEGWVPLKE